MSGKTTLDQLAKCDTDQVFDLTPPLSVEMVLEEYPSPSVLKNLAKMQKLGICTGEAIMSLVGQAPIDPINLMSTLMQIQPEGWTFSAVDFSMFRVLAQTPKKAVAAALRVDLMGGALMALVLNQANQLTVYRTLEVEPSADMFNKIQFLCDAAVEAAKREGKTQT